MPETPPLLTAINLTLTTIDRRMRLYRALVVYVIITGLSVPFLSIYLQSWMILTVITSIIPAVAIYLYVDKSVVRNWAGDVMTLAREEKLDLSQFQQTISSFKHIPAATRQAMLSLLTPHNT